MTSGSSTSPRTSRARSPSSTPTGGRCPCRPSARTARSDLLRRRTSLGYSAGVRRTLPALIALLLVPLAPACDGGGGRSGVDPCDTPQAPLLGCEPPAARTELPTVEDACRRLVGCGF